MRFRLVTAALLMATPALAQSDLTASINGHEIAVTHPTGDVLASLMLDGQEVVAAQYWIGLPEGTAPEPVMVGGVPVLVVETHPGGNACEGPMPMILTLPEGAPAVAYGPAENCAPVEVVYEADAIRLISASDETEITWTPERGMH